MLEAANPLLLQRLGKANSRRRQIFRYNRIHNDKLKHGVDALVSRVEPVPMFAAHYGEQQETATSVGSRGQDEINRSTSSHAAPTLTTETTIATFIESKTDEMELDHDDGLSETSSAASEGPLDEEDSKLRLPEPPSGALEGGFFECPYCFEIAKTPSSSKWRYVE